MKKFLYALLPALLFATMSSAQIKTPAPSPSSELKATVGLTEITINYSRPGVKDRTIYADDGLVPFGKVWRTGANAATTIEFSEDVVFGGKEVEAGKYALYTIPRLEGWTVMLYSDLTLGGNVGNYDEENEVARTEAQPYEMAWPVETFTIDVGSLRDDSAVLGLVWEKTFVGVPIEVHTDKQVSEQIDKFAANPMAQVAGNYLNSGWYLYNKGDDMDKALEFMSKGCEHTTSPFKYFWLNRKAQVQAKMGDYKGAITTAHEAHKAGQSAPENAQGFYNDTVKGQLDESIKKWSSMD